MPLFLWQICQAIRLHPRSSLLNVYDDASLDYLMGPRQGMVEFSSGVLRGSLSCAKYLLGILSAQTVTFTKDLDDLSA